MGSMKIHVLLLVWGFREGSRKDIPSRHSVLRVWICWEVRLWTFMLWY